MTVSRRRMLGGLAVGGLAGLVACGTGTSRQDGVGDARPGTRVAAVSDIPVGGGELVDVGSNGYLLVCQPQRGDIRAYNPTCPHMGATVAAPDNGVIVCPAHGSRFNPATGAVEQGPAAKGLAQIPVTVNNVQIVLA